MTNEQAYEMGKKTGAQFGFDAHKFEMEARYGCENYPEWIGANALSLFWECGLRGLEMPKRVRAVRIGKLPARGFSTNFRDQKAEAGVSVLHIEGCERQDNHTYDLFNSGEKITIEGWLHFRTGGDGEPLLVEAVEVN